MFVPILSHILHISSSGYGNRRKATIIIFKKNALTYWEEHRHRIQMGRKRTCSCSPKKWTGANNFTGFIFQPLRLAGDRGHDNNVGVCGTSHFARGGVPQTQKLSFRYRHRCLPTDLKISLFLDQWCFPRTRNRLAALFKNPATKRPPPSPAQNNPS